MGFSWFLVGFLRRSGPLRHGNAIGYKPLGRFPVEFQAVKLNDEVWLTRDKDGYITRAPLQGL